MLNYLVRSQRQHKIWAQHTPSLAMGDANEETFWMAEGSGSPLDLSTFTVITRGGSPDPAKMVCLFKALHLHSPT